MADEVYEIRVDGTIPPDQVLDFEGLDAAAEPAVTVLHGPVADQAALYSILARLRSLGLEVVEVRRLPEQRRGDDPPAGSAEQGGGPAHTPEDEG